MSNLCFRFGLASLLMNSTERGLRLGRFPAGDVPSVDRQSIAQCAFFSVNAVHPAILVYHAQDSSTRSIWACTSADTVHSVGAKRPEGKASPLVPEMIHVTARQRCMLCECAARTHNEKCTFVCVLEVCEIGLSGFYGKMA